MKIAGHSITIVNQKLVVFNRKNSKGESAEIKIIVSPLPMSFERKYEKTGAMQYPIPPTVPIRDDKNGKVLLMEDGSIASERNTSDPDFLRKFANADRRVSALKFSVVVREDESIEFESKAPSFNATDDSEGAVNEWKKSWIKYTDCLADELEAAGFTSGELVHVLNTSEKLDVSTADEKVQSDF